MNTGSNFRRTLGGSLIPASCLLDDSAELDQNKSVTCSEATWPHASYSIAHPKKLLREVSDNERMHSCLSYCNARLLSALKGMHTHPCLILSTLPWQNDTSLIQRCKRVQKTPFPQSARTDQCILGLQAVIPSILYLTNAEIESHLLVLDPNLKIDDIPFCLCLAVD